MNSSRRAFLTLAAGVAGFCLLPGCASGTEDPAKTRRFTTFFTGLLAGRVEDVGLSADLKRALTPEHVAETQRLFAGLGTFEHLRFLGQDTLQGYRRFHYAAQFGHGASVVMFVLDGDGHIAGFFKE